MKRLFFVDCPVKMSMKNIIYKINENRYFLLFVLLFAYVQSIYTRIGGRQQINVYTFTPEGAIASSKHWIRQLKSWRNWTRCDQPLIF